MTHKIVSAVVGLIVVLFAAAALLFAWGVSARAPEPQVRRVPGPPAVPHDVQGSAAPCGRCHQTGGEGMPRTHRAFSADTCVRCHPVQLAASIPHGVSMGEARCALCHGEGPAPLSVPLSHRAYRGERCAFCHQQDPSRAAVQPSPAGESAKKAPPIRHSLRGLFEDCLSCHEVGGKPVMPASHHGFGEGTCRFVCHFRPAGS